MGNKTSREVKEEFFKLNFFKQVWYSITKFEKYPEMAATGTKKALFYFTKIILIFTIIYSVSYLYYISEVKQYEESNLTLGQKMFTELDKSIYNEEQMEILTDGINQYNDTEIVIVFFISALIAFFLSRLIDVVALSILGYITCYFFKIKINYKAVFNMSIFALTLSIILMIIYSIITIFTDFNVKYFDVMYDAIAYISLLAAIFMIRSDVMKKNMELMRILEESKQKIGETILNNKKEEKQDEDEEETEDEEEKKEKNKEKNKKENTQGEGSNA